MFRIIIDGRKRREIDPTREMLRSCLEAKENSRELDAYSRERIQALSDFMETTSGWYTQLSRWPQATIQRFLKLGDQALKILGLGGG
jgi:DNA-binding transcriptional regulator GbsR (MarR family)